MTLNLLFTEGDNMRNRYMIKLILSLSCIIIITSAVCYGSWTWSTTQSTDENDHGPFTSEMLKDLSTLTLEDNLSNSIVAGATSYKVYSSDDPYQDLGNWNFEEEVIDTNWSESYSEEKKFYYVTAVN